MHETRENTNRSLFFDFFFCLFFFFTKKNPKVPRHYWQITLCGSLNLLIIKLFLIYLFDWIIMNKIRIIKVSTRYLNVLLLKILMSQHEGDIPVPEHLQPFDAAGIRARLQVRSSEFGGGWFCHSTVPAPPLAGGANQHKPDVGELGRRPPPWTNTTADVFRSTLDCSPLELPVLMFSLFLAYSVSSKQAAQWKKLKVKGWLYFLYICYLKQMSRRQHATLLHRGIKSSKNI